MYFGSVRFFKHLILGLLALLIIVPIAVSIVLGIQNHQYRVRLGLAEAEGAPPGGWSAQAKELGAPGGPVEPSPTPEPPFEPQAEDPAYQSLYPELYAEPARRATVNEEKTAFLTFDDGPSIQTPKILAVLEQYGVQATFFAVGKTDEQSQQWMRDIVEAGHALGIHSYSHDYRQIYASVEDFLADFDQMYRCIYDATGVYPQIFRFPGGSINAYDATLYREIIAEMTRRGFVYFDWNVSAADAAGGTYSVDTVRENVLAGVENLRRAFVLMHDSEAKGPTVEALPSLIEGFQNAGFTFQALSPEVVPVIFGYKE